MAIVVYSEEVSNPVFPLNKLHDIPIISTFIPLHPYSDKVIG